MRILYTILWNHKYYGTTDVYEMLEFVSWLEPSLKVKVGPTDLYLPKIEKL